MKPFPHLHAVENTADPLFDQAVAAVREARRASVSLVQRQLKIGFNRAARLLDDMEKAGVVSAENDKGARRVLDAGDEFPLRPLTHSRTNRRTTRAVNLGRGTRICVARTAERCFRPSTTSSRFCRTIRSGMASSASNCSRCES